VPTAPKPAILERPELTAALAARVDPVARALLAAQVSRQVLTPRAVTVVPVVPELSAATVAMAWQARRVPLRVLRDKPAVPAATPVTAGQVAPVVQQVPAAGSRAVAPTATAATAGLPELPEMAPLAAADSRLL
jgi:hypothetical protein